MASSPGALVARVLDRFLPAAPPAAPPANDVRTVARTAADYLEPAARWPLVWVTNIAGWSEDPVTTRVSFTLKQPGRYTSEETSFNCALPCSEGDLFEKRGAYVVIALPAGDEARVRAILAAAGRA
jgi:hypothetical protein